MDAWSGHQDSAGRVLPDRLTKSHGPDEELPCPVPHAQPGSHLLRPPASYRTRRVLSNAIVSAGVRSYSAGRGVRNWPVTTAGLPVASHGIGTRGRRSYHASEKDFAAAGRCAITPGSGYSTHRFLPEPMGTSD